MKAQDVSASFLFVGDLNGLHQEWLGSTTANRDVAAFDFATVSGCDQLVVGPTHALGGTLDLQMTDVPNLVRVAVVAPIGNSDNSSMSAVISIAQIKVNVFYGQEPPSGESTTTEHGVNYQLLAVMCWSSPMGNS